MEAPRLERFFAAARGPRSLVVGILNVTPDSFSDGGRHETVDAAVEAAGAMAAAGAAAIDVGGESTRPGFSPVDPETEWRRIGVVVEALAAALPVPVSVDTTKADVARRALAAGAAIVNDIWGLQGDGALAEIVAETGAGLIAMHNRGAVDPSIDIVDDMRAFFDRTLAIADRAGIGRDRIILDPGIGFGKTPSQQIEALNGVAALKAYGVPVLVGVSRKSFLGRITGSDVGRRLPETLAANLAAARRGATLFRVHDVAEHVAAFKVWDAAQGAAA